MQYGEEVNLQLRLKNCLETILELEPDLKRLDLAHVLLKEYDLLKSFIERLGQVRLEEDDVRRIEKATANFLDELKLPLTLVRIPEERLRVMH